MLVNSSRSSSKKPKVPFVGDRKTSFTPLITVVSGLFLLVGCPAYFNPTPNIFVVSYFYILYTYYLLSMVFTVITAMVEEDLNLQLQGCIMLFATFSGICKLTAFWFTRHRHWKLKEIMVKTTKEVYSRLEYEVALEHRTLLFNVVKFILISYLTALSCFYFYPLFNEEFPIHLKLIGVDFTKTPGYEITYFWSMGLLSLSACSILAFDLSFFMVSVYVMSRLQLCVKYSAFIGAKAGEYSSDEKQRELITRIADIFAESYEFLNECSNLYGSGILASAFSSVGMFSCTLVYLIVNNYPAVIFGEIFAMGIQFLFYSLLGDMVLSRGLDVSHAIYNSDWYRLDKISDRKMILFLLTCAQRCAGFSIGGFSILCRGSYTTFIRMCYGIAACMFNLLK